jgi:hypothetical protein
MSSKWTMADIESKGLKVSNSKGLKNEPAQKMHKLDQPASFALGRLKVGTMNKTEAAYANYLELQKHMGKVMWYEFEPINLRIASKCFYSVDFLVMLTNGQLECHEVKGFFTDDALVKIKAAAAKFPFRFIAVRLVKGAWEVREF